MGATEYAWLIEDGTSQPCNPLYYCGEYGWTHEHLKAVRFSRKEDAVSVSTALHSLFPHRIAEHGWD